jgi:hypothetical protein
LIVKINAFLTDLGAEIVPHIISINTSAAKSICVTIACLIDAQGRINALTLLQKVTL